MNNETNAPAVSVELDVAYRVVEGCDPALNTLDIYWAPDGVRGSRTVVVFLHGGSWSSGDKATVSEAKNSLPVWFVQRGCVFVAVNCRLPGHPRSPNAGVTDMLDDVAKALKWLNVNGRRYGGLSSGFVLLGFSSGAHLAALVVSDTSYLERYRLSAADVRGVVALDVPHYDLPLAMSTMEQNDLRLPNQARRLAGLYRLFSADPKTQARYSPAAHIGAWLCDTVFLLLSVGRHLGQPQLFSCRMSEDYAKKLKAAGIAAEHLHFDKLDHSELAHGMEPEIADAISAFLGKIRKSTTNRWIGK